MKNFKSELERLEKGCGKYNCGNNKDGWLCPSCQAKLQQALSDKQKIEKIFEELKDEIILNDIYTADEIVRIVNKKRKEVLGE